ncbi:MAG TPA: DUF5655 domain-containing protein [Bryobacteraceae bacterium]|nr:DUF5655 domain-containing protein [Bryobacteraceae bacterium]
MGKTPSEMQAAIAANLKRRTGKSVEEWADEARRFAPASRRGRVGWLITEHGLPRTAASMIAASAEGEAGYSDPAALLAAMFAGPRAALRPIYDDIVKAAKALGGDVQILTCRTQVTLRRRRQFAWIKPGAARLDLGLALTGVTPEGRLLPVGGTNEQDRVRLRIAVAARDEVDAELKRWLKTAYDLDER